MLNNSSHSRRWRLGSNHFKNVASPIRCSRIPCKSDVWTEHEIVRFMSLHPSRAYFSRLFRDGGFRHGMEVGVAGGRFSEHFLRDNSGLLHWVWYMVEPFPSLALKSKFAISDKGTADFLSKRGSWALNNIGSNAFKIFLKDLSSNAKLLRDLPDKSFDFIYLDGAHDYANVKHELVTMWPKIRPGGVLAGHDYCDYREKPHPTCTGCDNVPLCGVYTESFEKLKGSSVESQWAVVHAVHEWLHEYYPLLPLYHTLETFTRESLELDGMDFDLVLTKTRNPSWFVVKPL